MNIAFGKFGRTINFNKDSWNGSSGDHEPVMFLELIAKDNPEHDFYLIGRNNYKGDIPNIIDIWSIRPKEIEHNDWVKSLDIDFDFGIFFGGPTSRVNIPNFLKKKDGNFYKPLIMFKGYVAPILHVLNESQMPWYLFACDVRYTALDARDITNLPKKVFAQYEGTSTWTSITSMEDHTMKETYHDFEFSMLETMWCMTQNYPTEAHQKTEKFSVILNQGHVSPKYRMAYLEDYIFNDFPEVSIFGKWDKKVMAENDQFKGLLPFYDLQNYLQSLKYSILFPLYDGWITPKFYEFIHHDVIPFFHHDYDDKEYFKVDPFLRVTSGADLKNKIQFLEDNPSEYNRLLESLRGMRDPNFYDGTYIKNYFNICKELTYGRQ